MNDIVARRNEPRRAALCIGVSRYSDARLSSLPAAGDSARAVGRAMENTLFGTSRVVVDPAGTFDLFDALQKAIHEARGGALFLYFAGFLLDRGGDPLLAVVSSDSARASDCVPWSDVLDLLQREKVARALVIFNVERTSAAPITKIAHPSLFVLTSARRHDPDMRDVPLRDYGTAVVAALKDTPTDVEAWLTEAMLDAEGLDRFLAEKAAKDAKHTRACGGASSAVVLRDLREALKKPEPPKPPPEPPKPEPKPEPEPPPVAEPPPAPEPEPVAEPEVEKAPPPVEEPVASPPLEEPAPEPAAIAEPEPKPELEAPKEEPAPLAAQAPAEPTPSRMPWILILLLGIALVLWWFLRRRGAP